MQMLRIFGRLAFPYIPYVIIITGLVGATQLRASGNPNPTPVFLMAGQSNAIGNEDSALYANLITTLLGNSTTKNLTMVTLLNQWYQTPYRSYAYSPSVTVNEVSKVLQYSCSESRTRSGQFIDKTFTSPMSTAFCSMTDIAISSALKVAINLDDNNGCGHPYGPELGFAKSLININKSNTKRFIVSKIVKGGTTIKEWLGTAPSPSIWDVLTSRIRNINALHPDCTTGGPGCRWEALIWFQGTCSRCLCLFCDDTNLWQKY